MQKGIHIGKVLVKMPENFGDIPTIITSKSLQLNPRRPISSLVDLAA